MTPITSEQKQAVQAAGNSPVELKDPQSGATYVLIRSELFEQLCSALPHPLPEEMEHLAWAVLARKAREQWAAENAY
jgi:hypothetical protein